LSRFYARGATATFIRPFSTSAGADGGAPAVDAGVAASVADVVAVRLAETDVELAKIGTQLGELDAEIKVLKARLAAAESKPESLRDVEEIRSLGVRLHDVSQDKSLLGQKESRLGQEKIISLQRQASATGIVRVSATPVAGRVYSTCPLSSFHATSFVLSVCIPDRSSTPCRYSYLCAPETSNARLNALLSLGVGDFKKHGFDEQALLTGGLFNQSVLLRDRKEQVREFLALVYERWSLKV